MFFFIIANYPSLHRALCHISTRHSPGSYAVWVIFMKQLPPLSMRFPLWFCFYTFCIVLEVFCAINLHPWNVSELPPPSAPNSDTGSSSLHPLSVYIPPHLSLSPPTVWTLGWRAPVGQYGDCEGGAREESSSNLFQGEAGSVGVEVDQAVQPQYGASELSFASGVKLGSCMLSVKPEHLWKELWNVCPIHWLSSLNSKAPLPLHSIITEE